MKVNKFFRLVAAWLAVMLMATGCAGTATPSETSAGKTNGSSAEIDSSATGIALSAVSSDDIDSSWDESTATKINFSGNDIVIDGTGANANGSILTITAGGTYVLDGNLTDGQVVIDANENDTVRLVLNGVEIACAAGAPIYAASAGKLVIILADGTQNTVTDGGENFAYANAADEEPDAAIFSKCDLTINGMGSLTVQAGFNNGIGTKDDLIIVSGIYRIQAANHGMRGRDSLTVLDGNFEITAGNDAMQSNNDEDAEKGWISLEGGVYNLTAQNDGIQAETVLAISGGEYAIATGGGVSGTSSESDSYKGLKATTDMRITGGTFVIDSLDDCVHANGNILISGGDFTLASSGEESDGIHADAELSVSGGNIRVTQSYEGLEAATVTISAGTVNLVASDDAINASGGDDSTADGEAAGQNPPGFSSGLNSINITGGDIVLAAGGDGIDSNGDINISGGTTIALINSSADNGAVDCDGTFTVTGGTIIYGGTGVGQTPGGNSTQSYVYASGEISANTEISVRKDGETLISFMPAIDCQYLAFSLPDITSGESYEVYSASSLLSTATAGTGGGNMMPFGGMREMPPDGTGERPPRGTGEMAPQ